MDGRLKVGEDNASHDLESAMAGLSNKLDPDTLAKARAAGLDRAVVEFPDCVADAAHTAALDLADVPAIEGTTEPWPSMRIRSRR